MPDQMIDTARQVADWAYRQGIGEATAVDDLIAEVERKERALAQASEDASRLREAIMAAHDALSERPRIRLTQRAERALAILDAALSERPEP